MIGPGTPATPSGHFISSCVYGNKKEPWQLTKTCLHELNIGANIAIMASGSHWIFFPTETTTQKKYFNLDAIAKIM